MGRGSLAIAPNRLASALSALQRVKARDARRALLEGSESPRDECVILGHILLALGARLACASLRFVLGGRSERRDP